MIRGTTPTYTCTLPFDTNMLKKCFMLFSQNNELIIKKTMQEATFEGKNISFTLTQEETFKCSDQYNLEIQLRVVTQEDDVLATLPVNETVYKCLDEEIIQ